MEKEISKETKNDWHKDPNNWRFGFLYYNMLDKRIFPPKKIKEMGWTINFANPFSVIAFCVLILFILIITYLTTTYYEK